MKKDSNKISLRALELEDIEILYAWENDSRLWEVSNTKTPFSRYVLKQYLSISHQDIYTTKQLRLVIESVKYKSPVGLIDLFDIDPYHLRAGVGIFIDNQLEGKGFAKSAIVSLKEYAKKHLGLHQLYCNIQEKNTKSIYIFEQQGFVKKGIKEAWIKTSEGWENVIFFQYLL